MYDIDEVGFHGLLRGATRHDHRRPTARFRTDGVSPHVGGEGRIEGGEGVVEKEDGRSRIEDSSERHACLLPSREGHPPLPRFRHIAEGPAGHVGSEADSREDGGVAVEVGGRIITRGVEVKGGERRKGEERRGERGREGNV